MVLGAMTLAQLHKNVGDIVTVTDGGPRPFSVRIVGTATLPSMGVAATLHTEMGTGAVLPYQDIPGAAGNEPNNILVTLRPGANLAAQQKVLQTIVPANVGGVVLPVQRPAEIADYQSMGTAPVILAGALALGALSSLLLTLMSSVRRRRRDLALLKTLGFTRRQLSATVAWQSTAAITVGAIVGVPLGIALGRALWDLFAAADQRRAAADGPGADRRAHRGRRAGHRQRGGPAARRGGRPHPRGRAAARRVTPLPACRPQSCAAGYWSSYSSVRSAAPDSALKASWTPGRRWCRARASPRRVRGSSRRRGSTGSPGRRRGRAVPCRRPGPWRRR